MQSQQPPQMRLNPMDSTGITCNSCGGSFFKQTLLIRKWSKFSVGMPNDVIDFIPAFRCDDCGEAFKEMIPSDLPGLEKFKSIENG